MRVAVYTRISTAGQKDGTSPDEQRRILSEIAERQGWEADVFEEVASAGDGAAGLPILTEVLGRITIGDYSKLLVYHLDRLNRAGVGGGEQIKAILAKVGCEIVTPGGKYDPRNEGDDLRSDVEWLLAKQEHRRIFHRTYGGLEARARKGETRLGHTVPFGYRVVYAPDGASHVEVIPSEAAVIRRAYELVFSGIGGAQAIASALMREGFAGRGGRRLHHYTVGYWLKNPRYAGMEFRRSAHSGWDRKRRKFATGTEQVMAPSSAWPAIVTLDDWARAQAILKRLRDGRAKAASSALGGLLRCRSCGAPMHSFTHHPDLTLWYRCQARVLKKPCKEKPIMAEEAHRAAYRWIKKMLSGGFPEVKRPETPDERPAIEAALADIRRQEDRLMEALLGGVLTDEQVARKNGELRLQRETLNARLRALPRRTEPAKPLAIDPEVLAGVDPDLWGDLFHRLARTLLASVVLEPASVREVRDARGSRRPRQTYRVIKAETNSGVSYVATNR